MEAKIKKLKNKNERVEQIMTTVAMKKDKCKKRTIIKNKGRANRRKQGARIGTWNVKSLLRAGKMAEVAQEMTKYRYISTTGSKMEGRR